MSLMLYEELCEICMNDFTEPCLGCSNDEPDSYNVVNGLPCNVSFGKCGHIFHEDCINVYMYDSWVNRHNKCPFGCVWKTSKTVSKYNDFENIQVLSLLPKKLSPIISILKVYIGPYPLSCT